MTNPGLNPLDEGTAAQNGHNTQQFERLMSSSGWKPDGLARRLTDSEIKYLEEGLMEMDRMADACARISKRIEELEPNFRKAMIKKGKTLLILLPAFVMALPLSYLWSWPASVIAPAAIIMLILAGWLLPVHHYVVGTLRDDAKLTRELDREGLSITRKMSRLGRKLNADLKRRLEAEKQN